MAQLPKQNSTHTFSESSFAANTVAVVSSIFAHPSEMTAINLNTGQEVEPKTTIELKKPPTVKPPEGTVGWQQAPEARPRIANLSPTFKLVFLSVLGITVFAGLAEIAMAIAWTSPTANQQATFEAIGFAWKAGIGAIFGLLGGKVT
jgi:hypothetical protein